MADPIFYCSKLETENGKPQVYDFYTLVNAVSADGSPVQIKQTSMKSTVANLTAAVAQAQKTVAHLQNLLSLIPIE